MPTLSLSLLGPFTATVDEAPLPKLQTAKVQALLSYLVVEATIAPGVSHPRETLMHLLWPDIAQKSAQNNLRQTLYRLRQIIPELTSRTTASPCPFLLADNQSVQVNEAAIFTLDVAEFSRLLAINVDNPDWLTQFALAVDLYRGDFLADFYLPDSEPFETWARTHRESLRRQMLDSLDRLTSHYISQASYDAAQTCARRYLELDNLHDQAHQQLITAMARKGQRSQALAQFERYRQLLAVELDVEPSAEMQTLYEAVRSGKLGLQAPPSAIRTDEAWPIASPPRHLADAQTRQAQLILLHRVRHFWIEGVLEQSLQPEAMIAIGKAEHPMLLASPWDTVIQKPEWSQNLLPPEKPIAEIFAEAGQALLILGAPGAGKTTLLLHLAQTKLRQAEQDPIQPIPVVFNLSSWSEKQYPLAQWLGDELNEKYLIPQRIGSKWVADDRLLLLLDGLDEVKPERQAACVAAINQFRQTHGLTPIVVCSREAEYQALTETLRLGQAIVLRPLSQQQVRNALLAGGSGLKAIADMLDQDKALQELTQSPLLLNILTLAYQDSSATDLAQLKSATDHRQHILAAYVRQMFRRREYSLPDSPTYIKRWLFWLAQAMSQRDQTIFLLEQLQPDWLPVRTQRWVYTLLTRLSVGLLGAIIFLIGFAIFPFQAVTIKITLATLLSGLFITGIIGVVTAIQFDRQLKQGARNIITRSPTWRTLFPTLSLGLLAILATALIFRLFGIRFEDGIGVGYWNGLFFGLLLGVRGRNRTVKNDIKPIETVTWSWEKALKGSILGLTLGTAIGLLDQFVTGSAGQPSTVIFFALLGGLVIGLSSSLQRGVVDLKVAPNQGIRLSLRYSLIIGIPFGVVGGLVMAVLGILGGQAVHVSRLGFILIISQVSLALGTVAALWYGGLEALNHFILRLILWYSGHLPVRCVRFLNDAVELIILRRIGGGYIFVHQHLQDYFANQD